MKLKTGNSNVVDAMDIDGRTVLMACCYFAKDVDCVRAVRALLDCGPDLSIVTTTG
jgi:hypothetical protein